MVFQLCMVLSHTNWNSASTNGGRNGCVIGNKKSLPELGSQEAFIKSLFVPIATHNMDKSCRHKVE